MTTADLPRQPTESAAKVRKQPTTADRVVSWIGLNLTIVANMVIWLTALVAALTNEDGREAAGWVVMVTFPIGFSIAVAGLIVSTIQMARLSRTFDRVAVALALLPATIFVVFIVIDGA